MRAGALIALLVVSLVVLVGCMSETEPPEIPEPSPPEAATEPAEEETLEPIIDQEVLDELEDKEWVQVSVVLHDMSNLSYDGAKSSEEKSQISELKKELNTQAMQQVLSTLSESEFQEESVSSAGYGFGGMITEEGIEKLRKNPVVWRIHKPLTAHTG